MDTNEHESDVGRAFQPVSTAREQATVKGQRADGPVPGVASGIRVDSCSFVVGSRNKNASDWSVRGVGRSRMGRERYRVVVVVIGEITGAVYDTRRNSGKSKLFRNSSVPAAESRRWAGLHLEHLA